MLKKKLDFLTTNLKDTDLPEELKGKSKAEIKTYVEKKRIEREALQESIAELNMKRRDYIAKKTKDSDNGLENALIKAIKTQAEQKNYKWEKS